jgi:hypothetical protein
MSELEGILRAVAIRSEHEYQLGDATFRVPQFTPPPFGGQFAPFAPGVPALVGDLQQRLYEHAYIQPLNGKIDLAPAPPARLDDGYLDALSAANATRERWDGGWQVAQLLPNDRLWAQKGTVRQSFAPGRYATPKGTAPYAGGAVNVFLTRESRELQPGFLHIFGETPLDDRCPFLTRLYFHVGAEGAALLVQAITSALNRFRVPFRMKTLAHRGLYTRADAAVLFFPKRNFPIVARLLGRICEAVRGHLRPRVPLMAKRLLDGVGLAEDPGNGESFGSSRCRLIAQAIWDAYTRGEGSPETRLREVETQFLRNGLALARPYLRAASADVYA